MSKEKNRNKLRWILGLVAVIAMLIIQIIPTTSMLAREGGLLWIIEMVFLILTTISCIVGILNSDKGSKYRIGHNVLLFVPLLIYLVRIVQAVMLVAEILSRGDPDVFSNLGAVLSAGFFVGLVFSIVLPIVGWVKISEKENNENEKFYEKDGIKKKKHMSNRTFRKILVPILSVMLIFIIVINTVTTMFEGFLDTTLGRGERHVVTIEGSENWDTDFYGTTLSVTEAKEQALEVLNQVTDEGMILLKNNGVLPLASGSDVSPFGKGYVFPFYDSPGTESSMKHSFDYAVSPKDALESYFNIISYAADLQPKYTDSTGSTSNGNSTFDTYPDQPLAAEGTKPIEDNSFGANGRIPELALSSYNSLTESQISEMEQSTGLVFVSRTAAEGMDLKYDGYTDGTPHYLALTQNEKDMIKKAKELCGNVVLLVNSTNPVELGPVMSGEYEVDAILWVGLPGEEGFNSMASILAGEVNPSGRLYDTLARDLLAGPEMANFGSYAYSNIEGAKYVEYDEGVYMGYRYYETAYDIGATNFVYGTLDDNGGVIEEGAVCYPFGYGLSYSDFSQEITSYSDSGDEIVINVKVSNSGEYAGKDVVQIYYTAPYTTFDMENGVEKPTAVLCAFAKTSLLEAGKEETVTLSFSKEEMASFCSSRDNGDGTTGCYILEEGTYDISLRANSHDIVEVREYKQDTTIYYDNSNPRQYEIEKQAAMDDEGNLLNYPEQQEENAEATFTAATSLFSYMDQYMTTETTILTRADWDNTVPVYTPRENYETDQTKELGQNFVDLIAERSNYDLETNTQLGTSENSLIYTSEMPISDADNGLTVSDMRGKDYYDEEWEKLLDQINWTEDHDVIEEYLLSSNYYTPAIDSIGLPYIVHTEGANGIRVAGTEEDQYLTVTWCMCPVMAATWNVELAEDIGTVMAAEALANGVTSRYSPAFNMHRSPFLGRNMEYYSEDPFLTGMFVANMLSGSTTGGLIEYMKHFGLNDQETNRSGVYTWATEQTVREIYNKPFEMCIRLARKTINYIADEDGNVETKIMRGATGMMIAQNAFGPTIAWVNYDLVTGLIRNEWNFHGVINTDWSYPCFTPGAYGDMTIFAGTDTWLTGNSKTSGEKGFFGTYDNMINDMESATAITAYREAIHHIAYQIANSGAMQGVAPGSVSYYDVSPWKIMLRTSNIIGGLLITLGIAWIVIRTLQAKKRPEEYRKK